MASLLRRRTERGDSSASIGSSLLPKLLDDKHLAGLDTLNILDFGRANRASLEFFNQYPCRLCVLDAAEPILQWSESVAERDENPPSQQQLQHELAGILDTMGEHLYDLVFFWDTLNHLHESALGAFANLMRRHLTPGFRGHGFILHKKGTEQQLRHMGLASQQEIRILAQSPARLHAHNRKVINEALGADLKIDHGVLHGDGRLEFLLAAGTSRPRSPR